MYKLKINLISVKIGVDLEDCCLCHRHNHYKKPKDNVLGLDLDHGAGSASLWRRSVVG